VDVKTPVEEVDESEIITPDILIPWYQPCGELLVFKKPEQTHQVSIKTTKEKYEPGEQVEFEVEVTYSDGTPVGDDTYVSVFITDETVFS